MNDKHTGAILAVVRQQFINRDFANMRLNPAKPRAIEMPPSPIDKNRMIAGAVFRKPRHTKQPESKIAGKLGCASTQMLEVDIGSTACNPDIIASTDRCVGTG